MADDLATPVSKPIDVKAMTKAYGKVEALRSLKLAERQGLAVRTTTPDGTEQWFATK